MKILLFILLLSGHISYGQIVLRGVTTISTDCINGDSVNNSPNFQFNDRIKLSQIDKSSATVDIRLYRLHSLSNTRTLHRLFLIDTTWQAVEYDEWNKPVKIKKYKLKPKTNFDSLFLKLLSHNILTLLNQSELKNKLEQNSETTIEGERTITRMVTVLDGDLFTVEMKIADKFRVIKFENPEIYFKYYPTVPEFSDYLNIVETMNNELTKSNNR